MKPETQKIVIERLLSSSDVFSRCIGIISSDYFDPELRPVIKFIQEYFLKYNSIPKVDYINAEYETEFKLTSLDQTDVKFSCDQIELFCKQGALYAAIMDSAADVTSGKSENFGKVLERVQTALAVSIQRELGIDMYENLAERLETYVDTDVYESTGILGLDTALGGGFARKQVTLFSANTGGGKSLMLSNLGANYSRRGFNVLQLALELTEQMIDLRNISILTGIHITEWKQNVAEIIGTIKAHKEAGAGSFIFKRIPGGSSVNNIRSYLKLYEAEYGFRPDVLIVDYLDLMSPNGGTKDKGIYEQDKEKSEQLAELAYEYDCITLTASQQNRDGVRAPVPDQAIIAGGISKINTVDNYISIYMNPEMRLNGELFLYYLKTRSSSAVGSMTKLAFNPNNLIISDTKVNTVSVISAIRERHKRKNDVVVFPGTDGTTEIPDEYVDIISRYHEEEEATQTKYGTGERVVDITDDTQLWNDRRTGIKIFATEDAEELISMMGQL